MACQYSSLWRDLIKEGGNIAAKAIPIVLLVWVIWQMGSAMTPQVKGRNGATNSLCYGL
jgi:hypothetical protein